jgi:hypothetical protein
MMELNVLGMIFARRQSCRPWQGLLAPCRRLPNPLLSVLDANAQLIAPIDPGPA